ncbi:MAG: agmatine deiminase [Elusimicrobiota bacterium]|jgi:agmatine deiminase|nr:agmatine deiminase [Elusimicrobiota bacterium]
MKTLKTTPKQDGFFMPAEFERHSKTYMIWPERPDVWRCGAFFAQKTFAEVALSIAKYEPTVVLASSIQYENAKNKLSNSDQISVIEMSSNDSWVRDTGATFVKNQEGILRGIDWKFNAWGGLTDGVYFPWDKDDLIAQKICDLENVDRYRLDDFILEGGSIHVDGKGTALTTESCLLSYGRNPSMTKEAIEMKLKLYLNVEKVIWLKRGIYLDETNEHIDNIACFVRPGVIALAWTDDTNDPQHELSKSCYEILSNETDANGQKLEIHKIPLPKPQILTKQESTNTAFCSTFQTKNSGYRLSASYVNYYVCNNAVIMPAFDDSSDKKAKEILQKLYPNRDIIQIYSREILLGGGNIHCITQQIPERLQA